VLREARLVVDQRIGREHVFTVNPVPLQSVAGWLEGYRAFWQSSLNQLKRNLEGTWRNPLRYSTLRACTTYPRVVPAHAGIHNRCRPKIKEGLCPTAQATVRVACDERNSAKSLRWRTCEISQRRGSMSQSLPDLIGRTGIPERR
jgi:hypothetical protein